MCAHGHPRPYFNPLKFLNFDFNADPDPAFHSYADPDLASKNKADPGAATLLFIECCERACLTSPFTSEWDSFANADFKMT